MLYLFIENVARHIMEWAMQKQYNQRPIIDEIKDTYSFPLLQKVKV